MRILKIGLVVLVALTALTSFLWWRRDRDATTEPTVPAPQEHALPTVETVIETTWSEWFWGLTSLENLIFGLVVLAATVFIIGAIWGGYQIVKDGTSVWPKRFFYAVMGVSFLVLMGSLLMTYAGFTGAILRLIASRDGALAPLVGVGSGELPALPLSADELLHINLETIALVGGITLLAIVLYREQKKKG